MTITSPTQIQQLGTIMGVWAHPDDETFMSAGLMAAAVANGQNVVCVTATKGEAGVQDPLRWPANTLGQTRALELIEALQVLGVHHHHWLDYADGGCKQVADDDALAQLMPLLQKYQPDTIVTFPPDGLTGHDDHRTVSRWAGLLAAKSQKPVRVLHGVTSTEDYESFFKEIDEKINMYFNIDQPKLYPKSTCDIVFELSDDLLKKKCQALELMPSQTAMLLKAFTFEYLCRAFADECFVQAK